MDRLLSRLKASDALQLLQADPAWLEFHPRVLLVEGEPRLLDSLQRLLSGLGYLLHGAASGREAMQQLQQLQFDLVMLDLHLPGVDAHDVLDEVRLRQPGAQVIVTSRVSASEAATGVLQRGAYGFLRKPYHHEELRKTVANALQQRRLEVENQRITLQLERSEKMYRYLVDNSPDIIYTLDQDGRFTFVNDRVQHLLGFRCEELIGQHYSMLVHAGDMERANYVFNEGRSTFRQPRTIELRFRSRGFEHEARTFSNELVLAALDGAGQAVPDNPQRRRPLMTYGVARDITDRKRADEQIAYQAYHDTLTHLPNRALFMDRLGLALLQARRNGDHLAVMFIDLDRFKVVNDTLGHGAGDVLLQQVSQRLMANLRRCDTLSRPGGDEFTVVLPGLGSKQEAAHIADKFVESLRLPFLVSGQTVHMSTSIGVALYPDDGRTLEELVRNADVAMYHMKSMGKNGHAFFDAGLLPTAPQTITLEHDLHLALERQELEMFYQPQVDVHTQKITGAEALMRWNHPRRGFLGAAEFLPFAEESGLLIPISNWMLESICRDCLAWNALGGPALRLSLNISPQYLDRGDFFDKLQDALLRHRIAPAQIEVEVTENICIRNPQIAIDQLDKLCQLGVSVAIDDFGTGYSSLSYLHRFPVHTIKIDRSFVTEIRDADGHFPVVLAIVAIARGLGLNLVAEGVETPLQAGYLADAGCRTMQGFLYHQPMSQSRLLALLQAQASPASSPQ